MGRPPRTFSDKEVEQIEDMALTNCHTGTIAKVMDIPKETLARRFGSLISKKRAEGRVLLRKAQAECVTDKVPSMLIFLGKNDLDQTDRQDINLGGNVSISLEREKSEPQEADTGDNSA